MIGSFFVTNGITIVCMVYIVLILLMYYVKRKVMGISGKVFLSLLLFTILTIITNIIWGIFAIRLSSLTPIFAKITIFMIVNWSLMLICYMSIVFRTEEENKAFFANHSKKTYIIGTILVLLNLLCVLLLKYETIQSGKLFSLGGNAMLYVNIMGGISIIYSIIIFIINRKKLDTITPILASLVIFICVFSIVLGLSGIMPLNDMCFLHTSVVMFLYLSLESQDKALLEEYNESNRKAKESNILKTEFIMNMSHQLRTPMNTILGYSELLLLDENISQNELNDESKNMQVASRKLLDLINGILDVSKIESKKEIINDEDYKLENVIYDINSLVKSKKLTEKVRFVLNANPNCPNDLNGDRYKLSKTLKIILSNILNNTAFGEVSLNISSSLSSNQIHEFTFNIKSTANIENYMNIDFDNLIKVNNDGNNDINVRKLNFLIAKGLINLMNGNIEYINNPGQATQYIIKIKQKILTQNALGDINEKIQRREQLLQSKLNLDGKKILIIDDKEVNTIVLERLLKEYGNITIESVNSARKGIEKALFMSYDLIFTNHEIEETTGEEIAKKLEVNGRKKPIVIGLITGVSQVTNTKNYTALLDCPVEYKQLDEILKIIFGTKE